MINKQEEIQSSQIVEKELVEMETEENKEAIKKLEEFEVIWTPKKVEILLVVGGFKKATEIEFESEQWYDGDENKKNNENEIWQFENICKKMGLIFEKQILVTKSNRAYEEDNFEHVRNIERVTYLLAKNESDIEKLKRADKGEDDNLYGEVYGFPNSSIDAFKNGELSGINDIPLNIRGSEAYLFATFMLSKNNWKEELKTTQKWSDFVKKISPEIHKEQIRIMKEVVTDREKEAGQLDNQ